MSIYKKLARIQRKLMGVEMSKSGYNGFKKFHYYELEDILPHIFQACFEEELTLFFSFTEDQAVLHIKSWEKEGTVGTRDEVSIRAPFPEITPNKGDNKIQTAGAYMTYLKRYLLMNTFLITEKDVIDAANNKCDCSCNDKPVAKKSKKAPSKKGAKAKADKSVEKPEKLKNAINLAKNNGGITADNVCYQADMLLKKGVVSKDQSEDIKAYVHEHGVEV